MSRSIYYLALIVLFFTVGCIEPPEQETVPELIETEELSFPSGFSFSTSVEVTLEIKDAVTSGNTRFEVSYLENSVERVIGAFGGKGGTSTHAVKVPSYVSELSVKKWSGATQSITSAAVQSDRALADFTLITPTTSTPRPAVNNGSETCTDHLYAVENSQGGFWTIDVTTGNYEETQLANLQGGGSIACALDQANGLLYYNVNNTMYKYDIDAQSFSVAHNGNPFGRSYPRLAYRDGFFWMSNGTTLYKVDAITNATAATYSIQGFINNNGGGDLDFDSNGDLYLACFSGLYKFTEFAGSTATITRISAENFPFQLTSMAIDRQDRIFVGTNDGNSNLIQISPEDGSYQIVKTYNHKINDLTAWKCATDQLEQQDSDNDGVIDVLDDHPNDPDAAYDVFTPSEIGMGTLAFEDLWPITGDYDFNDLVMGYRFTNVMNSNNLSVRLEIDLTIRAIGAGNHNGFGIELPLDASVIESVTGYEVYGNSVSLNSKGLENGQAKPVIIAFNDAYDHMSPPAGAQFVNTVASEASVTPKEFKIIVTFTEPIDAAPLAAAPFNPFIFVGGDRTKEVHLAGKAPTSLANTSLFGTEDDDSNIGLAKYYQTEENVPWAIDVIHTFRYPIEKSRVDRAYNHFRNWGRSNGATYRDWYGDNSGYRNLSKIYNY